MNTFWKSVRNILETPSTWEGFKAEVKYYWCVFKRCHFYWGRFLALLIGCIGTLVGSFAILLNWTALGFVTVGFVQAFIMAFTPTLLGLACTGLVWLSISFVKEVKHYQWQLREHRKYQDRIDTWAY